MAIAKVASSEAITRVRRTRVIFAVVILSVLRMIYSEV